jgi:hypothetical protein
MAWVGAVFAGVGALQQGNASSAANVYNAEMGWQNAKIARQTALDQAKQVSRENYLRLGDMRASMGGSGVTGGSFLDVLGDTAAQGELQRQQTLYAGEVKANMLARGASLSEAEAATSRMGGYLKAAGALTGGSYGSVRAAGSNTSRAGTEENFSGS